MKRSLEFVSPTVLDKVFGALEPPSLSRFLATSPKQIANINAKLSAFSLASISHVM